MSVEELTKALGNWSPTDRCRAAWELVARPDTRSLVPQLITAVEGPDAWLRKGACEALGQFKAPEALPVLIRLLHHEDRGLRWLAARDQTYALLTILEWVDTHLHLAAGLAGFWLLLQAATVLLGCIFPCLPATGRRHRHPW